ncbi:DUF5689 domain-containing protein [Aequorivita echinoideorum]|uniref:Choice-of-anchor J domain-containing protein n=1 Tax=Aequorivita echinoideorum TaxID=1549647 RepID=A0ABS5S192_9FLAO|nr:DUF5689 domain-containing protein [Aequorivita echinoideorum]MBT0606973.1 choice-of-anchor J domain-containing protein [Aequorivita echinoideorum]
MKNLKKLKFLSFLFIVGMILTSCVQDDDFRTPEITSVEPDIEPNFTIALLKSTYDGFEPVELGADSDIPLFIEAYVVSSDESGNFFKTLIIQDAPENPTAGIAISTEAVDLYTKYEPGRKIYFRVDGLYTGEFAGLPTIGTRSGDEIGRISVEDFENRIFRSLESETLVPTVIPISQALSDARLSTLVQFENVQFLSEFNGDTYANCDSTFSENRVIEDCENNSIVVRNSGFADFRCVALPTGNGTLTAITSVFNGTYQLFIRDVEDVDLTGDRCAIDPIEVGVVELPFMENFEGQSAGTGAAVNIEFWTNVNVNGGARIWEVREFSSNKYAQTSAFNSDENPYEAWLITPGLNLQNQTSATLNFDTKDGFYNGDALTVSVSTDYNGDITNATWTDLNATIAQGSTSGYPENFTNSGNIDLSAYAGQVVYIRFKYVGSDSGVTTTYQVDNISVQ